MLLLLTLGLKPLQLYNGNWGTYRNQLSQGEELFCVAVYFNQMVKCTPAARQKGRALN